LSIYVLRIEHLVYLTSGTNSILKIILIFLNDIVYVTISLVTGTKLSILLTQNHVIWSYPQPTKSNPYLHNIFSKNASRHYSFMSHFQVGTLQQNFQPPNLFIPCFPCIRKIYVQSIITINLTTVVLLEEPKTLRFSLCRVFHDFRA
jgi:hypothetical protein